VGSPLQYLYPAVETIRTLKHHAAVEPEDAPELRTKLRENQLTLSKASQFVLLTSVRVSDAFGGGREKSEPFKWKHRGHHVAAFFQIGAAMGKLFGRQAETRDAAPAGRSLTLVNTSG
jgi:hypothetical protein